MTDTSGTPARIETVRAARQRAWSRFLLIALALHVPLFVYPILRLGDWLDAHWLVTTGFLVPLTASQFLVRTYLRGRNDGLSIALRRAADFWLGLAPLLLMTLLVFELLVAMNVVGTYRAGLLTLTIAGLSGFAGVMVASTPVVRTIHLTSPKLEKPIRFAQITDVHIGSRSRRFLEQIMLRINRLSPDFLCITGDFIDQTGIEASELVSLRSALCPVYFSTGNHERYEDFEDILARLRQMNVQVLRSESVQHRDDVQVIGIDDAEDPGQVGRELESIDVNDTGFVVLLYHRPQGLEDAAACGVDLMLSGHTHNGQIFPFNLVVRQVFDRIVGLYEHDDTKLYVSQGTGTWGPVIRFGTRAEITEFVVSPEPDKTRK